MLLLILFTGEDAIATGGGVSFNVDFDVKKSKSKKMAQTPMKPKIEDRQDVRVIFLNLFIHLHVQRKPYTFYMKSEYYRMSVNTHRMQCHAF